MTFTVIESQVGLVTSTYTEAGKEETRLCRQGKVLFRLQDSQLHLGPVRQTLADARKDVARMLKRNPDAIYYVVDESARVCETIWKAAQHESYDRSQNWRVNFAIGAVVLVLGALPAYGAVWITPGMAWLVGASLHLGTFLLWCVLLRLGLLSPAVAGCVALIASAFGAWIISAIHTWGTG